MTTIIEGVTISETPSNPMTIHDHIPALTSQNHVSFTRNQAIVLGTITLRNK
jgi:hypothetical protein